MSTARPNARRDATEDRTALLASSGLLLAAFGVGSVVQTEFIYARATVTGGGLIAERLASNGLGAFVNLLMLAGFGVHRMRSAWWRGMSTLAIAAIASAARLAAQLNLGVYQAPGIETWLTELLSALTVVAVSDGMGVRYMTSRRKLRQQVRVAAANGTQVQLALQALQHEEIRVRREVAEGLHGSLQQRLVLITARIDNVLSHFADRTVSEADAIALRQVRGDLEVVREGDVREMSRLLYPDAIEIGLVPAVRSLLGRLPASIGTRLVVSDAVRRLDDPAAPSLTQTERLLAVRVVEEAVTNALRHGGATRLDVVVREEAGRLQLVVTDNGQGYDPAATDRNERSGLARLGDRLTIVGGSLDTASTPGAGATVTAWLPIARAAV